MQEISLFILDIAMNSINAQATDIKLTIDNSINIFSFCIEDNTMGFDISRAFDPFFTTSSNKKVGMGLPLLKMTACQTGGDATILLNKSGAVVVKAWFYKSHIDCPVIGDLQQTIDVIELFATNFSVVINQ